MARETKQDLYNQIEELTRTINAQKAVISRYRNKTVVKNTTTTATR